MLKALTDYDGLPHRTRSVGEVGAVDFVDDSKGTNVGATSAALMGLGADMAGGARIVLIAGGDGKGQDFTPLCAPVARHCRALVLIGRDGVAIGTALRSACATIANAATLPEAVRIAGRHAMPGDIVLLSPACASYDMFRDYVERARVFTAAVRELVTAAATVIPVRVAAANTLGVSAGARGTCDA